MVSELQRQRQRVYDRRYYEKNRKLRTEKSRRWYHENKEKRRAYLCSLKTRSEPEPKTTNSVGVINAFLSGKRK